MTRKLTTLLAATAILAGLGTAPAVFAEENTSSSQPPRHTTDMMGGHTGMMDMMGQMSPDQMNQMARMVSNCNRMMETMTTTPTAPHGKATTEHPG